MDAFSQFPCKQIILNSQHTIIPHISEQFAAGIPDCFPVDHNKTAWDFVFDVMFNTMCHHHLMHSLCISIIGFLRYDDHFCAVHHALICRTHQHTELSGDEICPCCNDCFLRSGNFSEQIIFVMFRVNGLESVLSRPNHVWENLDDDEFLLKLGATGIGEDGKVHPTSAGLLMFGYEYEILREYPNYFLDYREEYDDVHRWTDRFISSSGDWSGNVFDFYFHVYNKLQLDLKVPFEMQGGFRVDDTPVHKAIREALANCLVNADYYGRRGLVIIKKRDLITMSNPGDFRVELAEAQSGGMSDPRNGIMMKMFNLIDIGERAGSGIPSIWYTWKQQGWDTPTIVQSFNPNRIVLSLPLIKSADKKVLIKGADKKLPIKTAAKKDMIIAYLTDNGTATGAELCELLDLKPTRVRTILREMIAGGIVMAQGGNRNRTYKLKA